MVAEIEFLAVFAGSYTDDLRVQRARDDHDGDGEQEQDVAW